jgi:Ferritin-like domain
MTQPVPPYRKSTDKEADAMASNIEVLDPSAKVEKLKKNDREFALNRRHFMGALGVAGAAAGTSLMSSSAAFAQQPKPNGFLEVDVLNFLLNIKYLKATFYSYITQGADLPATSHVTVGTGGVFNQPAKIAFTGTTAAQITDMFNEMYFDELNQLIDLRNLLGTAVLPRQTINLLGTGVTTNATTTLTPSQAIAMSRMLEDVSASAFAGAAIYLTGTNLAYATQVLAADGFHAGAVRLVSIQTGSTYQGTGSLINFQVGTVVGSATLSAVFPATPPFPLANLVGDAISGIGIPSGAVITAVNVLPNLTPTAVAVKGSATLNTVSSVAGVVPGQPITGTNIPAQTIVISANPAASTITMSAAASGATTVAPNGIVTSGSPIITSVSSLNGVANGQTVSGTGIPGTATVLTTGGTATGGPNGSSNFTITMTANATVSSIFAFTGTTTLGSTLITFVSAVTGGTGVLGLLSGQPITGAGIPPNTTIVAVAGNTVTISAPATATTTTLSGSFAFTGIVTSGSNIIANVSSVNGLIVGQVITGTGIATGAKITVVGATTSTVTMSLPATSTPVVTPTGVLTYSSNVITSVSSISGLVVGQIITGPGIPAGTTITASSSTGGNTITMSAPATTQPSGLPVTVSSPTTSALKSPSGVNMTSPTTETVTVGTIGVSSTGVSNISIGQSTIIISLPATVLGSTTALVAAPDPQDVAPGDPGAALAALGPAPVPSSSPAILQGFFSTAGAATSTANTPPGFAFARTFSQVLAILYGGGTATGIQSNIGGFFPVGVSGNINVV